MQTHGVDIGASCLLHAITLLLLPVMTASGRGEDAAKPAEVVFRKSETPCLRRRPANHLALAGWELIFYRRLDTVRPGFLSGLETRHETALRSPPGVLQVPVQVHIG